MPPPPYAYSQNLASPIFNNVSITGSLQVAGTSNLSGNVTAGANLAVTGNETVGGNLGVTGAINGANVNVSGTFNIGAGNFTVNSQGNMTVQGASTFVGAVNGNILGTGAAGRVVRTAGDVTTTSTSLVDLTGAAVTFTTAARPVLFGMSGSCYNDTLNANTEYAPVVDGTVQLGSTGGIATNEAGVLLRENASFSFQTAALTAASHTFKMQWRVGGGTGTTEANSSRANAFWAQELR